MRTHHALLALFGTTAFAAPIAQVPVPVPVPAPVGPAPVPVPVPVPAPVGPAPVPVPVPVPAPPAPPAAAGLAAPPVVADPQIKPDTKDDSLVRAGLAERRVNAAMDELKVNINELNASVRSVVPGNPASLGPLSKSAEATELAMNDAIVRIDSAGVTNIAGALAIQRNAEEMLVMLDRLADDMILQKPAIVANNAAPVVVQMLQSQNIKVARLMDGIVDSLPPVARPAAKEKIVKAGNPLEKVIVAFSSP